MNEKKGWDEAVVGGHFVHGRKKQLQDLHMYYMPLSYVDKVASPPS